MYEKKKNKEKKYHQWIKVIKVVGVVWGLNVTHAFIVGPYKETSFTKTQALVPYKEINPRIEAYNGSIVLAYKF